MYVNVDMLHFLMLDMDMLPSKSTITSPRGTI